jgi:hypothetical protein
MGRERSGDGGGGWQMDGDTERKRNRNIAGRKKQDRNLTAKELGLLAFTLSRFNLDGGSSLRERGHGLINARWGLAVITPWPPRHAEH